MTERISPEMAAFETPRPFRLDDVVSVELQERIPPEEGGDWKHTGRNFVGRLTNGPGSLLTDPEQGTVLYVAPIVPFKPLSGEAADTVYENTHPRPISGEAFDPYEQGDLRYRLIVEHAGSAALEWADMMESGRD